MFRALSAEFFVYGVLGVTSLLSYLLGARGFLPQEIGLAVGIAQILMFLLMPVIGSRLDSVKRKNLFISCVLLAAAACFALFAFNKELL